MVKSRADKMVPLKRETFPMAPHSQPPEARRWSGAIDKLGEDERRSLVDSMTSDARPRIEIDEALANGWCEMWYQPKIDLKRKCLAGAEALARIRHPDYGVLLPGSFLPRPTAGSIARRHPPWRNAPRTSRAR